VRNTNPFKQAILKYLIFVDFMYFYRKHIFFQTTMTAKAHHANMEQLALTCCLITITRVLWDMQEEIAV